MNEIDILAKTYYHTCKVIRPIAIKDDIFDDFKDEVIYEDIACAVSFNQGSTQGSTDTVQHIEYIATLFARPDIVIEPGDKIKAKVFGRTYNFLAGEGAVYQSHIEVPLIRNDIA